LIQPFFLRRDKKTLMDIPGTEATKGFVLKAVKHDFVIWLTLTPVQLEIYKKLLTSKMFTRALTTEDKKSSFTVFQSLSLLKLVCDHPWLLLHETQLQEELCRVKRQGIDDESPTTVRLPTRCQSTHQTFDEDPEDSTPGFECSMIQDCGKMMFLCGLLPLLQSQGHRVLIFSRSLKMLNIIQLWLQSQGIRHSRIDGSSKKSVDRQRLVDAFNTNPEIFCCLLTSQVGGVGLNLTGADRVIVVDPDWNPSTDNQAIDRAYRISQTRDVVVYRLITCGTIEEKIYRHQVFKHWMGTATMRRYLRHVC
jgi:SNF2 family DNA or RNA helicase